ncbi:MAG: pyrimidine 5'-nucleotidase, partial [Chloroflexi bacterium]|nr:pyrimidine 5'-nucleotidase [Chloroflexota bacterium]
AAEGAQVTLVCLTHGGAGGPPEVRAQEIARSAQILGAQLELWDYPDGGLAHSDAWEIVGRLVEVIRRIHPQVVLTFGPNQLSEHPDHVIAGWLTTLAFELAGNCARWPGSLPAYAPAKLYFSIDPDTAQHIAPCCLSVVNVAAYLDRRLAALECHESQRQCWEGFLRGRAPHGLWREYFQLAACRTALPAGPEADLFEGVFDTAPVGMTMIAPPPKESPIWLFDLDNTLYSASVGLMEAISARIDEFIGTRLNLPPALAQAVREAYNGQYGSSVRGVLRHCQVDAGDFLDFIHDLPLEHYLSPDAPLAELLAALPGRKYLFTNALADYARRALRALGVEQHFDEVFDIHFAGLEGKPSPAVYEKVLAALGHPAGACWFVEDSATNLVPAKALGCRTVWLTADGAPRQAYVEHVIHDLAELREVAQGRPEKRERRDGEQR